MSEDTIVGHRLRALRRERGLSLTDVARATNISRSFLSLIENNKSDITISRLVRLVNFYGIDFSDLLPGESPAGAIVVRSTDQRHIVSPVEGIDVFLLAPDTNRMMMPILSVYEPRGEFAGYARHVGEEFILVLEGRIELKLEGAADVVLEEGDSAYYKAERAHSFRNVGDRTAKLFAVVSPPNWPSPDRV